jgi:hypothetical protein
MPKIEMPPPLVQEVVHEDQRHAVKGLGRVEFHCWTLPQAGGGVCNEAHKSRHRDNGLRAR